MREQLDFFEDNTSFKLNNKVGRVEAELLRGPACVLWTLPVSVEFQGWMQIVLATSVHNVEIYLAVRHCGGSGGGLSVSVRVQRLVDGHLKNLKRKRII